ncbi:uncharacterized protein TEOVI_000680600 [Trypanosoma equiperdum]|uniref:Uncharacterized protein n=1 Tax=Trypanosoma equiperdum TaxID=5694 RepID=A0A1G4I6X0_TRYEQ|nr:hypothetical protein, conserved [Trypanosoma equiperdum]
MSARNKMGLEQAGSAVPSSTSGYVSTSRHSKTSESRRSGDRQVVRGMDSVRSFFSRNCKPAEVNKPSSCRRRALQTSLPVEGGNTTRGEIVAKSLDSWITKRPASASASHEVPAKVPDKRRFIRLSQSSLSSIMTDQSLVTQPLLDTPEGYDHTAGLRVESESGDLVSACTQRPVKNSHCVSPSLRCSNVGEPHLSISKQLTDDKCRIGKHNGSTKYMNNVVSSLPISIYSSPETFSCSNEATQQSNGKEGKVKAEKRPRPQMSPGQHTSMCSADQNQMAVSNDREMDERERLGTEPSNKLELPRGVLGIEGILSFEENPALARADFNVGLRVLVQREGEWLFATVVSREENGYVDVCLEGNGTTIRSTTSNLRVDEAKTGSSTERKISSGKDEKCAPLVSSPKQTNLEVIGMSEATSPNLTAPEKTQTGPCEEVSSKRVHPSVILMYVSPTVGERLGKDALHVLRNLTKSGTTLVDSPQKLQGASQRIMSAKEQYGVPQQCGKHLWGICFVLVSGTAEHYAREVRIIDEAHAVGISAVSLKWLERLHNEGSWNASSVSLPYPEELMDQNDGGVFRCSLLREAERTLRQHLVYIPIADPDIENLIELSGGKVTRTLPPNKQNCPGPSDPHWIYVKDGNQNPLRTSHPSIKTLSLERLRKRIHSYFATLPSSFSGQDDCTCFDVKADGTLVDKCLKTQDDENTASDGETAASKMGGEEHDFTLFARPCDYPTREEPKILPGEDYYFRLPRGDDREGQINQAFPVAMGRVLNVNGSSAHGRTVTMQLYRITRVYHVQDPQTGSITSRQCVCLGPETVSVMESDLIFDTGPFVFPLEAMQHLYILEQQQDCRDGASAGPPASPWNSQFSTMAPRPTQFRHRYS